MLAASACKQRRARHHRADRRLTHALASFPAELIKPIKSVLEPALGLMERYLSSAALLRVSVSSETTQSKPARTQRRYRARSPRPLSSPISRPSMPRRLPSRRRQLMALSAISSAAGVAPTSARFVTPDRTAAFANAPFSSSLPSTTFFDESRSCYPAAPPPGEYPG